MRPSIEFDPCGRSTAAENDNCPPLVVESAAVLLVTDVMRRFVPDKDRWPMFLVACAYMTGTAPMVRDHIIREIARQSSLWR